LNLSSIAKKQTRGSSCGLHNGQEADKGAHPVVCTTAKPAAKAAMMAALLPKSSLLLDFYSGGMI